MEFDKLLPFLEKYASDNNVGDEDVIKQLIKKVNNSADNNTETVDNEIIDPNADIEDNSEGQILETTFPELEIEDAIQQAKEEKPFENIQRVDQNHEGLFKRSYWELLKEKYASRDDSRKDSIKE